MKIPMGRRTDNRPGNYFLDVPENTDEAKTSLFLLGKQGIGKTNLLMNMVLHLNDLYLETKGRYGCIPVIFAPTFEWTKLRNKTNTENPFVRFPPNEDARGIEAVHYSFKMSNVPDYLKETVQLIRIDFDELTVEDIAAFGNMSNDFVALGKIQKMLELVKKIRGTVTLDNFLEAAQADKPIFDALYYIFKRMEADGLFDKSLKKFSWEEALRARKPIVFDFGEIDERGIYQALGGILLRELWRVSTRFLNAKYKAMRATEFKGTISLSTDEQWFLDNFVIGLFFEEAHQFFPPTTTKVLKSFPSSFYFKRISMEMGRKRGFKFNFLISQRLELLFKEFRTEFDYLLLGSKVDATDRLMIEEMLKRHLPNMLLVRAVVKLISNNEKFGFSCTNMNKLSAGAAIYKFRAYTSPCGQ